MSEALILLQRLESGNGKVSWDALSHRYASKTHASQMQVIEAIFQCKQTEGIEEHVSMWRNLMLNPPTMPRRAAFRPGRGIRGTRIPRGKARIVRGFCEFAGAITIVRNSAPFRAIWSADVRVRARI